MICLIFGWACLYAVFFAFLRLKSIFRRTEFLDTYLALTAIAIDLLFNVYANKALKRQSFRSKTSLFWVVGLFIRGLLRGIGPWAGLNPKQFRIRINFLTERLD